MKTLSSLPLILPRMWGLHPPLCGAVLTDEDKVASGHLLNMHLVLGTVKKVLQTRREGFSREGTVACKSEAVSPCEFHHGGEREARPSTKWKDCIDTHHFQGPLYRVHPAGPGATP